MNRKMSSYLVDYLRDNMGKYLLVSSFLVIGVIFGFLTVGWMEKPALDELSSYFNSYTNDLKSQPDSEYGLILQAALRRNLPQVLLIYIAGAFLFGFPLVSLVIGWRGFTLGFTFAFLVEQASLNGALFSIAAMLPHNFLLLPAFLVMGVTGFDNSFGTFREQYIDKRLHSGRATPGRYSIIMSLMALVILMGCFIEAYVSHFISGLIIPVLF